MSSSVFKEYPVSPVASGYVDVLPQSDGEKPTSSSVKDAPPAVNTGSGVDVVVVMNKDGSVSVDHNALHDLLSKCYNIFG